MNNCDLSEIGKRIQILRKKANYTQEQVAEMMNVSVQMISNVERGNKAIKIENLLKLSEIFNISTDYILTGKENATDLQSAIIKLEALPEIDRKMIEAMIEFCREKNS